jgi:hypothetical protein
MLARGAVLRALSTKDQSHQWLSPSHQRPFLLICLDVPHGAPWFLFDSHGHEHDDNAKKAYVMNLWFSGKNRRRFASEVPWRQNGAWQFASRTADEYA